jgi:hypothetical protein
MPSRQWRRRRRRRSRSFGGVEAWRRGVEIGACTDVDSCAIVHCVLESDFRRLLGTGLKRDQLLLRSNPTKQTRTDGSLSNDSVLLLKQSAMTPSRRSLCNSAAWYLQSSTHT